MTLQQLRQSLYQLFIAHEIESPEADSGLLLMDYFQLDKTGLLLDRRMISPEEEAAVMDWVQRRIQGEPVQYILGHCPFMGLDFEVNPSTLIPRPETELLVEEAAQRLQEIDAESVWDIGCGSGCIGISLAKLLPKLHITEVDLSSDALKTAERTARRYGLEERMEFVRQDILRGMPQGVPQGIVSNPPYIPSREVERLDREVRDFEPRRALDGGEDGLIFYRRIIDDAPLTSGGVLLFEIGFDQGQAVADRMVQAGYERVEIKKDYAGLDRIVLGYKK